MQQNIPKNPFYPSFLKKKKNVKGPRKKFHLSKIPINKSILYMLKHRFYTMVIHLLLPAGSSSLKINLAGPAEAAKKLILCEYNNKRAI